MRIKDGFELREICGEHVILSHGMDNIDFSMKQRLSCGKRLWEKKKSAKKN